MAPEGTGQACHGSRRSPIWVGGGVSHGPRSDKNYDKKINRKMKTKVLFTALSQKFRDGKVLFVDTLDLKDIKTKDVMHALTGLSKVEGFGTINTKKEKTISSSWFQRKQQPLQTVSVTFHMSLEEVRNLNPVDVLNYRYLVITNPDASNDVLVS